MENDTRTVGRPVSLKVGNSSQQRGSMTRSNNTMKPLSKRPISMSLSRSQRQSMRFSAVAGLITTIGDSDCSQTTTGDSITTSGTEITPTITADDENDSCTDTTFDAVEFVTIEADWSNFQTTASHPTLSRLPPIRKDVYPIHQRPSIEYIQEFAFPHGVPIDFLDKERAKLLCSSTGDAVHVMRFCDAQGIQKYATCVLVHVCFQPTEDVLKQNLLQLAVSRVAVDIIKRAWLRYYTLSRSVLRDTLRSTLTQRPVSYKSVQSNSQSQHSSSRTGGSPRKSGNCIRGLEGISVHPMNPPLLSSGFTDSSSSTPSPKKRSSKRIHVNHINHNHSHNNNSSSSSNHNNNSGSSKQDGNMTNSTIITSNIPPHRNQHYLDQLSMTSSTTAGGGGGNIKTKNKKKFSYLQRFGTSFRKLVGGTGTGGGGDGTGSGSGGTGSGSGAGSVGSNINENINKQSHKNDGNLPAGGDEKVIVKTAMPPSIFSTLSPTRSTTKSSVSQGNPLIYSPISSNGTVFEGLETGGRSAAGGRRKRMDGLKMILDRLGYGGLRCGEDEGVAVTQRAYCLVTGQPGHHIEPLYNPYITLLATTTNPDTTNTHSTPCYPTSTP